MTATAQDILAAAQGKAAVQSQPQVDQPTEKQIKYFYDLVEKRLPQRARAQFTASVRNDKNAWNKKGLSKIIDGMLKINPQTIAELDAQEAAEAPQAPAPAPQRQPEVNIAESGFYVVGPENATHSSQVAIYMVQPSQSDPNRRVAKRMIDNGPKQKPSWEYEKGAIYKVSREGRQINVEQATALFGAAYKYCFMCSRLLTNKPSVDRGIGPVCAAKLDAGDF